MADQKELEKTIERVIRMEACFDTLQRAYENAEEIPPQELQQLLRYSESGQWLRDYEMDEQGLLPQDLKRGILAQDALYDFLESVLCETI